jgi:hypothetical protein
MGIDSAVFNCSVDPQRSATVYYGGAADARPGMWWPTFNARAAGGWVGTANQLIKFLVGVRNNTVLSAADTAMMLNENLGWYTYDGVYGQYHHHNGGGDNGADPPQGLNVAIVQLADGYDAVLLVNSLRPDVVELIVKAFETR